MAANGTNGANGTQHSVAERLQRDYILHDILENVDRYSKEYDKVDYEPLKNDVIKKVLDEDFDPEVQIRGFLKAFRHTPAYKAAFAKIESDQLKNQINSFIEGSSPEEIVGDKGFHPTKHPSPPTKHHFSLLSALKKLVSSGLEIKEFLEDGKAHVKEFLEDGEHVSPKHYLKDVPVLYEDKADTKVMEVSL